MTNHIIPFGKYKDQPVEAMAADRQYLDWLLAQSWFKDRYGDLFTIIINNFQEPAETPEHNAMQVRFLDNDYVYGLLSPVVGFGENGSVVSKEFERNGWDVFVTLRDIGQREAEAMDARLEELCDSGRITEYHELAGKIKQAEIYIEIKPSVSDDFPAVLRQLKNTKRKYSGCCKTRGAVLLVGEYHGVGATRDEFVSIMANEGITVIFDR